METANLLFRKYDLHFVPADGTGMVFATLFSSETSF